ncbi:ABC transporter ATP-binding protein [Ornithinicoccus hortensis]|uniref:ABC-2 type transport system ATP-binding protein n=1 Tax=Ornithinicoccus hortensis TaxID=82346 RepID=A0A542YRB3_9MICO|nr:ATP-binding cassette domain-containing protein [Ornithinicoccus hortensis]TQL50587.1 ABC-2 type transport system ATP-binding protein [Ornithinicoccus hortensis]
MGNSPDGGNAVTTRGLRKSFRSVRGRRPAVHGLDLDVPAGGVHAFLGPNGSGKTTTIRMLLGLLHADAGTMHIFGAPVPARLPQVIDRVGAIVESPKFFPAFTAEQNLRLLADAIGTPRERVGQVLEATGLHERGKDRFAGFSLGMKQRLAIAATLLKEPDLLIFDEPTNGLDPAGIHEIRQTMRRLGDEGRTVLVSSHILAEVEQIADTVSIIGRGRVVAQGSVAGIIGAQGAEALEVTVPQADRDRAVGVLRGAGLEVAGDTGPLAVVGAPDPTQVTRLLAEQRIYLSRLVPVRRDLESVFLELTREDALGAPNPPAGSTPGTSTEERR